MFTHPTLIARAAADRHESILAEARVRRQLRAASPEVTREAPARSWLSALRLHFPSFRGPVSHPR